MPKAEDINLEGLKDFSIDDLKTILEVDKAKWAKEADEIENYYDTTFGDHMPKELRDSLATLKANCAE